MTTTYNEQTDNISASLDKTLRLIWFWVNGAILPGTGAVLYILGLQISP
ncbi:hypothetical protein [Azonexus hydrophilus]|uniref:Uncharacterized protein n=1 Tax=Azonexus hydrophilus TaxID=418702 RepID=A0ABZ2XJE6_9RHOO